MGSFDGLRIGVSGLTAAQRGIEITGQNLANAGTEGYTRRRVEVADVSWGHPTLPSNPTYRPGGIEVEGTSRIRDDIEDRAFRAAATQSGAADVRAEIAARAENILGPLEGGTVDSMGDFFTSFEELALDPSDQTSRQRVLAAAEQLTRSLNDAAQRTQAVRVDIDGRVVQVVNRIDSLGDQIAVVNGHLMQAAVLGEQPLTLLDQRDKLLDELSRLTAVTIRKRDTITDVFVGGMPLVRGTEVDAIQLDSGTPVWASNGRPAVVGGELGALIEARELTLPSIEATLDNVASTLETSVNDTHALGFDLNGLPGGAFFSGSTAETIAVAAGLTPDGIAASSTGNPDDGAHALVLADVGDDTSGGLSVSEELLSLAGQLGSSAAAADEARAPAAEYLERAETRRMETTGVSLDEEMAELIKLQRAYEASARVVSTVDELLDRLINATGRVGL
ncbi:MAG: flagellar hook-associated protein FlgK [Actinomycetota bacterium]|nr:flagellar hook-associated protein FlgK [Actinomycetota bacterium]